MDRNMKYQDMQEYAKTLGINAFGMKKPELIEAIETAEREQRHPDPVGEPGSVGPPGVPEPEGITEYGLYAPSEPSRGEDFDMDEQESEPEETPVPAPDPAMMAVVAAQQAVEKAMAQLAQVKPQGKQGTTEEEIARRQAKDAAEIDRMQKKEITLTPGMGIGEPKAYYPCVNGKVVGIVPGQKKSVPLSVYEVMQRSFAQRVKNLKTMEARSRAAIKDGI